MSDQAANPFLLLDVAGLEVDEQNGVIRVKPNTAGTLQDGLDNLQRLLTGPLKVELEQSAKLAQTNRDLSEALLERLAQSAAREGILRDTVRVNHEHLELYEPDRYPGTGLEDANTKALALPDDNTALQIVLQNRGDIVERVRQFNTIAGNTDDVYNPRQAALYFGLQFEEMAEKLTHLGMPVSAHALDNMGKQFKRGEYDQHFEEADRLAILDDDIDITVVTLGSLLSMGASIHGAFAEVHRANMAKIWPDGTMHRDANGKIVKPEGWTPPDLMPFVCKLTAE